MEKELCRRMLELKDEIVELTAAVLHLASVMLDE